MCLPLSYQSANQDWRSGTAVTRPPCAATCFPGPPPGAGAGPPASSVPQSPVPKGPREIPSLGFRDRLQNGGWQILAREPATCFIGNKATRYISAALTIPDCVA